jgi:hypothetical protein
MHPTGVASIPGEIATASYRLPRGPSVRLVTPAAGVIPLDRSIDIGCRTMVRREPPIGPLAPRPGPRAKLPHNCHAECPGRSAEAAVVRRTRSAATAPIQAPVPRVAC